MFCPNCGTRVDSGSICPNCSCNLTYAVTKVNEWENYIKAAEAYAENNASKPARKLKLGYFIPGVICYIVLIGFIFFKLLVGGTSYETGIDAFYSNLEKIGFVKVSDKVYQYQGENSIMVMDTGKGYLGSYNNEYDDYYYYSTGKYNYNEKKTNYILSVNYDVNKTDYSCSSTPKSFEYRCSGIRSDIIDEAETMKKIIDQLLTKSGITLEELEAELDE